MAILGGGKWQRRIIKTLQEAHSPLRIRQLRIRCGILQHMDPTGSGLRNALRTLVIGGFIRRIALGIFTLSK